MSERYKEYDIYFNQNKVYKDTLYEKNISGIRQFRTQNLKYPSQADFKNIDFINHYWRDNDRLWKLSDIYYKDPSYWWVIAFINKKPTESDYTNGDIILIPRSLEQILNIIKG